MAAIGVAWEHGIVEDLFCQAFNVPVPYPRGTHISLEVFMLLTGLLMSDGSWCDFSTWPAAWAPAGSLQGAAVSAQPRPKPRHNPWSPCRIRAAALGGGVW